MNISITTAKIDKNTMFAILTGELKPNGHDKGIFMGEYKARVLLAALDDPDSLRKALRAYLNVNTSAPVVTKTETSTPTPVVPTLAVTPTPAPATPPDAWRQSLDSAERTVTHNGKTYGLIKGSTYVWTVMADGKASHWRQAKVAVSFDPTPAVPTIKPAPVKAPAPIASPTPAPVPTASDSRSVVFEGLVKINGSDVYLRMYDNGTADYLAEKAFATR